MWICNVDLQENRKISKEESIPDGWVKGRNKWKVQSKRTCKSKNCTVCGVEFKSKNKHCSRKCGSTHSMSEEAKQKLSDYWSGKERPYRRGIKHNKSK